MLSPRLRPVLALLVAVAAAGLLSPLRPAAVHAQAAAFRPAPLPAEPDLPGPLRGLYDFNIRQEAPVGSYDTYIRYSWRELEPSEGVYNFALIDDHLAEARALGKRHGFRVRAMSSPNGLLVPDYVQAQMEQGWWADADKNGVLDTYVPDWNDPDFLAGFERLMAALAERYRHHPDLGWIDIGGYGNYGEFHTFGYAQPTSAATPATLTSILRIVDAHTNAFDPDDIYGPRLIMMTDHPDALRHALRRSPRIGWRRDSLGSSTFTDSSAWNQTWQEPLRAMLIADRWKNAPVVTEFIAPSRQTYPDSYILARQQVTDYHVSLVSNGNTKTWEFLDGPSRQALLDLGRATGYRFELDELAINGTLAPGGDIQVTARWENNGNAPAYEPYRAYFQLRSAGRVLFEAPLYANFETLLPTGGSPVSAADNLKLPATIGGGAYDVHLQIRDVRGYRGPLPLAIEGRQADGSYRLGQLTLEGPPVDLPPHNVPSPTCTARQYNGDASGRYGQISNQSYDAGTSFTLLDRSSDVVRGLVVTAAGNETQLAFVSGSYTVQSQGVYTVGLFSQNNNVGTHWVSIQTCVPPSPPVTPTPSFTPAPASPVATHTPTATVNPCPVTRYYGDGGGFQGRTNVDSYEAGSTFTLVDRSSPAVRAAYWLPNQPLAYLNQVGDQFTVPADNTYHLGFESQTQNLTSAWVDVRLCAPGASATPAQATLTPTLTPTGTATATPTGTSTATPTGTSTAQVPADTSTPLPISTSTSAPTDAATSSPTVTHTATQPAGTPTRTATRTPTRTATRTPTRTATTAANSCVTTRYYGDGSGNLGQYSTASYRAGTVFTLTARSSSSVWGAYWRQDQSVSKLSPVGNSFTTPSAYTYNLGFQSTSANRSSAWVDIRVCQPAP